MRCDSQHALLQNAIMDNLPTVPGTRLLHRTFAPTYQSGKRADKQLHRKGT